MELRERVASSTVAGRGGSWGLELQGLVGVLFCQPLMNTLTVTWSVVGRCHYSFRSLQWGRSEGVRSMPHSRVYDKLFLSSVFGNGFPGMNLVPLCVHRVLIYFDKLWLVGFVWFLLPG